MSASPSSKKNFKKSSKAQEDGEPPKATHKTQLERFKHYANNLAIKVLHGGVIAQMVEFMEAIEKPEILKFKRHTNLSQQKRLWFVPQTRKGRAPKEARKQENKLI
uniref:Uncharacterized protein n=1 Tax=Anopheles arabiensis TaxID=7173 RepID=A0A182HY73_ANOAR